MDRAMSPARSYAARLPQGLEGTLAGGHPMLNLLPAEQVGQLLGVDLGVVAVAVVEQDVGGLGLLGQGTDPGCPAGELCLGVPVAEPLVDVLAVPVLGVAVHAHHPQGGICSKVAPSWAACRSGPSPARTRFPASSATAGSTFFR